MMTSLPAAALASQNEPASCCHPPAIGLRRERRKQARPGEILRAALDLFVAHGFANTRIEDIATRAGVSKGTVYLYFTSKEGLLEAIINQHLHPLIEEASQMIEGHEGSSAALLRLLIAGWWERYGTTQLAGINKLMVAESGNFPALATHYVDTVVTPWTALVSRVIQRGMDQGEFRPGLDVPLNARILFAPMLVLVLWSHSLGLHSQSVVSPDRYLAQALDLMLGGLCLPPTASSPPNPSGDAS